VPLSAELLAWSTVQQLQAGTRWEMVDWSCMMLVSRPW
jgi:hypothetical protein